MMLINDGDQIRIRPWIGDCKAIPLTGIDVFPYSGPWGDWGAIQSKDQRSSQAYGQ